MFNIYQNYYFLSYHTAEYHTGHTSSEAEKTQIFLPVWYNVFLFCQYVFCGKGFICTISILNEMKEVAFKGPLETKIATDGLNVALVSLNLPPFPIVKSYF